MQQKSFHDLLKEAWEIYTNHFAFFLLLVVVLFLPFDLITVLTLPEASLFAGWDTEMPATTGIQGWIGNISSMISVFTGSLLIAASILGTAKAIKKEQIDFKSTLKESVKHWWPVFGTVVLLMLWMMLLFFLLIVPAIIFGIYWTFVLPIVVLGGKKYMKALKQSRVLVKGRWWEVCGRTIAVVCMMLPIILVLFIPATPLIDAAPWIESILNAILQIIFMYLTVFSVVYYLELERQHSTETEDSSIEEQK